MNWREINKDETELLTQAASFEHVMPTFFRDASNTWTTRREDVVQFYQNCDRLYGLFDKEQLVGLIYCEDISPVASNVHLDLQRGTSPEELIPCIKAIRDLRFSQGLELSMVWPLKRNTGIQKILAAAGFKFSGLEMRAGSSHGKVLKWIQMLVHKPVMEL